MESACHFPSIFNLHPSHKNACSMYRLGALRYQHLQCFKYMYICTCVRMYVCMCPFLHVFLLHGMCIVWLYNSSVVQALLFLCYERKHDVLLRVLCVLLLPILQEVREHRVLECKFFHTLYGSAGFAVMTNCYQFFVVADSSRNRDEIRVKKLPDLPCE